MFKSITSAVLALFIVFSGGLPAEAANKTVKVGTVATVIYPSSVKLKSSGCQTIPVKFKATKSYKKIWLATVYLADGDGNDAGGVEMVLDSDKGKNAFTVNAKVCRKDWDYDSENRFLGVKKGEYWLSFSVIDDNLGSGQADVAIKFN